MLGWSLETEPNHPGGGGVDHSFLGMLDFGDGLRASFDCSFTQPFRQRVELVGSDGTLELTSPYVPGRNRRGHDQGHGGMGPVLWLNGEPIAIRAADQYQLMVEHFVRAARGEEGLRYPTEEAIRQMKVLDALYESVAKQQPVQLLGKWR